MILDKKEKRFWKRVARKQQAQRQGLPPIEGLLIHRAKGDYDQEDHTFLMAAGSEAEALNRLDRHFPVYGLEAAPSAYDCTGRPFCSPAAVKLAAPGRYLVRLRISYDV